MKIKSKILITANCRRRLPDYLAENRVYQSSFKIDGGVLIWMMSSADFTLHLLAFRSPLKTEHLHTIYETYMHHFWRVYATFNMEKLAKFHLFCYTVKLKQFISIFSTRLIAYN